MLKTRFRFNVDLKDYVRRSDKVDLLMQMVEESKIERWENTDDSMLLWLNIFFILKKSFTLLTSISSCIESDPVPRVHFRWFYRRDAGRGSQYVLLAEWSGWNEVSYSSLQFRRFTVVWGWRVHCLDPGSWWTRCAPSVAYGQEIWVFPLESLVTSTMCYSRHSSPQSLRYCWVVTYHLWRG